MIEVARVEIVDPPPGEYEHHGSGTRGREELRVRPASDDIRRQNGGLVCQER